MQSEITDPEENIYTGALSTAGTDLLLEVYDQISSAEDVAYMTAALMTMSNYYSHALRLSNEINGRQGKNRMTIGTNSYKLMSYSMEVEVDSILDQKMTELFIDILNTYLADKQELPLSAKDAAGMLSRVKALMIMLLATNQYGIIPMLTLPRYILRMVTTLFADIQSIKEDVLDSWITYLETNNNVEMATIVRSVGNEFWGTEGIKANVIYERHFGKIRDSIHKPIETYEQYLKFRAAYRKSTKNILPSKVYDIFEITPDAYDNGRRNVYYEISALFPEDSNVEVVKRLIFETE